MTQALMLKLQPIQLTTCRKCNGVMVGKHWIYNFSPKDAESLAKKSVSLNESKFELDSVNLIDLSLERETARGVVSYSGSDGVHGEQVVDIPVLIGSISCPRCNKISGSSYEAIVQVRPSSGKMSQIFEQALALTIDFANKSANSKSNRYIMKQHDVQGGYDMYLGSKSFAESIVGRVTSSFFCEVTKTKKMFGREGGYDTYRYTYLVKIIDYERGSVLYINDHEYIVSSISQSAIKVISIDDGMPIQFTRSEFLHSRVRLSEMKAEVSEYIVITANQNEAILMDEAGKQITLQISVTGKENVALFKYKEKYYYTEQ
ncbi:MAG: NMD3-related protein [Candidatus Thermoplasmatota archaeon]|nr:NMD3-related protein [Candidatus Thermoplasmatota archaeon]